MEIKEILYAIFLLLALFGVLVWIAQIPNYVKCIEDPNLDNNKCFEEIIMEAPPIKEAVDLSEACENSEGECLTKIGVKVIESKIK